jgi:toxin ParE1/3/4
MKVRWTRNAADDLADIVEFIVMDNPKAAATLAETIKKSARQLSNFPKRGRVVPEFGNEEIREIIVGNYRVIYRIELKSIQILCVFEGHRLIPIKSEEFDDNI